MSIPKGNLRVLMRVREYSQATFKDAHEHPPTYVSNQMIPAKWHTGCGSVGHEQVQPPVVCRLLSCGGRPHRHSMNGVAAAGFVHWEGPRGKGRNQLHTVAEARMAG